VDKLSGVARDTHVDELKRIHDAALRLIDSFLDWDLLFTKQVSLVRDEYPQGGFSTEEIGAGPLVRHGRRLLLDALQAARRAGLLTVLDIHCSKNPLPKFGNELRVVEAHLANDIEAGAYTVASDIPQLVADGLLSVLSALADFEVLEDLLGERDGAFLRNQIADVQNRYSDTMNEKG
jgi:hypothetical protein